MLSKDKVKYYRKLNGLSQQGLSEKSGLSIRTIQRIEKGASEGSAHTLSAIAMALGIKNDELLASGLNIDTDNDNVLKWMNFSALLVLVIPLANVILPLYIYYKNQHIIKPEGYAKRILSFQILWSFFTLLFMVIIPMVLSFSFEMFRGSKIPSYVLVYFISVIVNTTIILRTAYKLSSKESVLDFVPNIL
ncbi:helix-turn-helix domain-containing protein [Aquimarina sp. MMG016]|uniref:helix-turn-helix domain-containing protein n=1 Tax=Aquimarina sp. MMG016 TaxID=2822690 RepID=UPI001B3A1A5B|nr:helix-turn-helix domain-containing protein [Aquimarina sp. MMG016]MBQ4822745.1 helix-turn-helix domain-containing protein [Aquimarina sp. MMG016]